MATKNKAPRKRNANFLRYCFAKGICKKGNGSKVEGLNKGSYTTISKALQGNDKAKKRLEKRSNLQGAGDVLPKKVRNSLKSEIDKRVAEGKKEAIDTTKIKYFKGENPFSDESIRDTARKQIIRFKKGTNKAGLKESKRQDRKELQSYLQSDRAKTFSKTSAKKRAIEKIKNKRISVEANKILANDRELTKMFLKSRGKK